MPATALEGAKGFEGLKSLADFEKEKQPSLTYKLGQVIGLGPGKKKVSDKEW